MLALAMSGNQGSHFVVATGIAADGSLLISDPDPSFGQTNLNGYLNGLATLAGAVRLLPQAPAIPNGFLIVSNAAVQVSSVAGICGTTLAFPAIAAVPSVTLADYAGDLNFRHCAGLILYIRAGRKRSGVLRRSYAGRHSYRLPRHPDRTTDRGLPGRMGDFSAQNHAF